MSNHARLQFGVSLDASRPEEIAPLARRIEELGYDLLGCGEHISRGSDTSVDLWVTTTLGVAAGATERIRLVTAITIAPLHHPVVLAKETALLDAASHGRLVVGVGVGGEFPIEFEALGVPVKQRGSRTDETLHILRRLWTEEGVSHQGRHFAFRDLTIRPRPAQRPHPPLWVGGRQEVAMRRAVRYGDGWYPYMFSPDRYRQSVERVRALAAEDGRDLSDFAWSILLYTRLDRSRERAVSQAGEYLGHRYLLPGDVEALIQRNCLVGTPDDVGARLEEYIAAGARNIYFNWTCSPEEAWSNAEIMAQEVVPQLRP